MLVPGDIASMTGGYEYDRRMLAGLAQQGWQPRLHALDAGFPMPSVAALSDAAAVLAALDDGACVVIDGLALGAMPAQVCAEAARLRIIALVHHPLALESGLAAAQAAQLRQSELQALRCVARVIVTSAATAAVLREWEVERDIRVVEPGTEVARPESRDIDRLLLPGHVVRLLCVATLVPRKGHDVLVQALAPLRHLPWRLDCVGSTSRHPATAAQLRSRLDATGLSGRVTLHGEISPAALAGLQSDADLCVLATRYEGYGMAVAEAVAAGLPVVATRTGAIAQLVGEERGLLVEPGDVAGLQRALHPLLSDARQLHHLSARCLAQLRPARDWSAAAADFAAALSA
ncbi:MAG: glycosyltransferase family 4 protein [Steroidobacteraceae bacterium]